MGNWFSWGGWWDDDADDAQAEPERESGSPLVDMTALVADARQRAEELRNQYDPYSDTGKEEDESSMLDCPGSLKKGIWNAAYKLGCLCDRYEAWQRAKSAMSNDFTTEKVYQHRIQTLMTEIEHAERTVDRLRVEERRLNERLQKGDVSVEVYDLERRPLSFRQQRALTRLEMAELGGTYEDIGDIVDQGEHILEDAYASDGGAMRRKIARKIRSMPRDRAITIIDMAVRDGVISQQTAEYLIRCYVRSR